MADITARFSYMRNDFELLWDERPRRVAKKCVHCGAPTRGRMISWKDSFVPAHIICAIGRFTGHVLEYYEVEG